MIIALDNKDIKKFYTFNVKHYKNRLFIHPLLLSLADTFSLEKNPFWKTVHFRFFMFVENGKSLGRIMVAVPLQSATQATFGYFESVDELRVAKALFAAAEDYAASFGTNKISGPYNPSLNYELGILIDGFDNAPYFMMSYNPSYYDKLLRHCGYQKEEDFYSFQLRPDDFIFSEKMNHALGKLTSNHAFSMRNVNLKNFKEECAALFTIYNDAFKNHFGFIPFTEAEFFYMAKDMAAILLPDFLKIAYWNDVPVAFILALPDLNQTLKHLHHGKLLPFGFLKFLWYKRKINRVRVINVAVMQAYQHLGLGAALYHAIYNEMYKHHFEVGQLSWIAESNATMLKIITELGAEKENIYRIYTKPL